MVYLSAIDDLTCQSIAIAYSDPMKDQAFLDKAVKIANATTKGDTRAQDDAFYKTGSAKNAKVMTPLQNKWDNDKTPLVGWTCK